MSCMEQRFGRGERLKSITLQGKGGGKSPVFYSTYSHKVTLENWEPFLLKRKNYFKRKERKFLTP